MSRPVELRRAGKVIARYFDIDPSERHPEGLSARAQAEAGARAMFQREPEEIKAEVTIAEGKDFELHCADGFLDSFDTEAEAEAALSARKAEHASLVESGAYRAIQARLRHKSVGALYGKADPGLFVRAAG